MKIRNGFVSNSSSSSFIVYGNEVNDEEELELLLRQSKRDLNKEAKDYYENDKKTDVFDYLFDKFKNKNNNVIITEDDQYYNLAERNVYEVDVNSFMDSLHKKDSWIRNVIKENIITSIYDTKIKYRDTCRGESPVENIYSNNAVDLNYMDKGLKRELLDYCVESAIDDLKHDLDRTKHLLGNSFKMYFISFSTDDGKREPFDSFFRTGIPFKNADIIRDERS